MTLEVVKRRLIWHGVFLVMLGLLTGAFVPLMTNTRMGVAAHLAGVQNGMLLAILGLLWGYVRLSPRVTQWTFPLLLYAMYALWVANLLGAFFGTSRLTPVAGEGYTGTPWQEALVAGLLGTGSVAIVIAIGLVLFGLRRTPPNAGHVEAETLGESG